ncbi:hypothetical protein HanIR_Chr09g0449951 [Helianthus annuus]|nr:hypothetical protein HanIR_Chr09g0449951 [Helianthus annuus]
MRLLNGSTLTSAEVTKLPLRGKNAPLRGNTLEETIDHLYHLSLGYTLGLSAFKA